MKIISIITSPTFNRETNTTFTTKNHFPYLWPIGWLRTRDSCNE